MMTCVRCQAIILIHWGRVTHIYISKLTIIGSDNDLSPARRHAIIWTSAGILSVGPLGINYSEILIKIHIDFHSSKCIWKYQEIGKHFVSAFCFNVLIYFVCPVVAQIFLKVSLVPGRIAKIIIADDIFAYVFNGINENYWRRRFKVHSLKVLIGNKSAQVQVWWLGLDQATCHLTHWGRDKMDAISQTTCSSAFSWMKMSEFRLKSHWRLFLRVELTIIQHCFR